MVKISFIISDETVLMELRPWQREVLKFSKEIIGTVKTSLVGDRSEESTLGNFVTDASVNYVILVNFFIHLNAVISFHLFRSTMLTR